MSESRQEAVKIEWQIDKKKRAQTYYYKVSDAISLWSVNDGGLQAYRRIFLAMAAFALAASGYFVALSFSGGFNHIIYYKFVPLLFPIIGISTTLEWMSVNEKRGQTVTFCAYLLIELEKGKNIRNVKDTFMSFGAAGKKSRIEFLGPYAELRGQKNDTFGDPINKGTKSNRIRTTVNSIPEHLISIFRAIIMFMVYSILDQANLIPWPSVH